MLMDDCNISRGVITRGSSGVYFSMWNLVVYGRYSRGNDV